MPPKKPKKLTLSRETVRHLSDAELAQAAGGTSQQACWSWWPCTEQQTTDC